MYGIEGALRSRQSRSCSRTTEWLPPQRAKLTLIHPLNMRFIKLHMTSDYFLALSFAIHEKPDPTQSNQNSTETGAPRTYVQNRPTVDSTNDGIQYIIRTYFGPEAPVENSTCDPANRRCDSKLWHENIRYLSIGVTILKDFILDEPLGHRSIYQAMLGCWREPECANQDSLSHVRQSQPPVRFKACYKQVLLAALRHFPYLSTIAPRCERGQKAVAPPPAEDAHIADFLRESREHGFLTRKVEKELTLLQCEPGTQTTTPSTLPPMEIVLKRRCGRPIANSYQFLRSTTHFTFHTGLTSASLSGGRLE